MLSVRLMPCLLLSRGALVKTVQFKNPTYVGDPINVVRIFNQKEVDELIVLDIGATANQRGIDFETLRKIATECFMPICYGGGVTSVAEMRSLFALGIEKISIGSAVIEQPDLINAAAAEFGSQAVVATLDVKRNIFGKPTVYTHSGTRNTRRHPVELAQEAVSRGAGEILLYSIDRDGTWSGFDLKLVSEVATNLSVPVIACGGCGTTSDARLVVRKGGASAVAIGSMAVFQAKDLGVLIKFPTRSEQEDIFAL